MVVQDLAIRYRSGQARCEIGSLRPLHLAVWGLGPALRSTSRRRLSARLPVDLGCEAVAPAASRLLGAWIRSFCSEPTFWRSHGEEVEANDGSGNPERET